MAADHKTDPTLYFVCTLTWRGVRGLEWRAILKQNHETFPHFQEGPNATSAAHGTSAVRELKRQGRTLIVMDLPTRHIQASSFSLSLWDEIWDKRARAH